MSSRKDLGVVELALEVAEELVGHRDHRGVHDRRHLDSPRGSSPSSPRCRQTRRLRNCFATDCSASVGHRSYQSIVQQLISEGTCGSAREGPADGRHREHDVQVLARDEELLEVVLGLGDAEVLGERAHRRHAFSSSFASRLGTSPELRMLLMSSMNSSTTCVSAKRNRGEPMLPSSPCRRPPRELLEVLAELNVAVALGQLDLEPSAAEKAASRVSDCLPEPPTPTSIALPRG